MLKLFIVLSHGKYMVNDDSGRTIYVIKKKLRGGYVIRDANKYQLYELGEGTVERHPEYPILLNGETVATYKCRSKFLEPRMELRTGEHIVSFRVADDKRMYYKIECQGKEIGSLTAISVAKALTGTSKAEYKYELHLDEKHFEAYYPMLPIATLECMIL